MSIFKNFFKKSAGPDYSWSAAEENPWGVRVLDIRSLTLTAGPEATETAQAITLDDQFEAETPSERVVSLELVYRLDRWLPDGPLFLPSHPHERWALFVRGDHLLAIRAQTREVAAVVNIERQPNRVRLLELCGFLTSEDESRQFSGQALDFLLRAYALGDIFPAPCPAPTAKHPAEAAQWAFANFGSRAQFAVFEDFHRGVPEQPLRTISPLHRAVLDGDLERVRGCLEQGLPLDLLANDGLAPLHWAAAAGQIEVLALLVELGAEPDQAGEEGETALMVAIQNSQPAAVEKLLELGADPHRTDQRGFTALHRAAEMGQLDTVRRLIEAGVDANVEARGYNAITLAAKHDQQAVIELLESLLEVDES
ncbi:MAG: ankyrin repeat domain-containing protein [Candidatus Eremiobacteraeota bacterium]|nr:ankyrin repeat domain-containing protein [Candidatus Eremiobacteraeota bacterium]